MSQINPSKTAMKPKIIWFTKRYYYYYKKKEALSHKDYTARFTTDSSEPDI